MINREKTQRAQSSNAWKTPPQFFQGLDPRRSREYFRYSPKEATAGGGNFFFQALEAAR